MNAATILFKSEQAHCKRKAQQQVADFISGHAHGIKSEQYGYTCPPF